MPLPLGPLALAALAMAGSFQAHMLSVGDGDTLRVRVSDRTITIRQAVR